MCLRYGYAKRMLYSEQPTVFLARRHLNTMHLTSFEKLNSILKIFQETHNFLVLMDPITICVSLKTTDRHFRDQGNVRHPTSKLQKHDLVQTVNTFWNSAAGNSSFVMFGFIIISAMKFAHTVYIQLLTIELLSVHLLF